MNVNCEIRMTVDLSAEIIAGNTELLSQLVKKTAFDVQAEAIKLAPVDTGALRNSISTSEVNNLTSTVDVAADYGLFVEIGTVKMRAQPFLIPAMEHNTKTFENAIAAAFGQGKITETNTPQVMEE